jgi:hypothetical protein
MKVAELRKINSYNISGVKDLLGGRMLLDDLWFLAASFESIRRFTCL